MDEICIAVAEWAKGWTTWGPSLPDEGGTGARRNACRVRRQGTREVPEAGAVAAWG
ncbi:hypothetical protein Sfulv_25950 [Streptomyces fulvorobeus]|uniref:Uncharacterized protein n=1 Tax=Streptomyces fulvorobeus TaxID=284028 RepID=A0A7J0C7B0_9ACTN|nr:hypothetical protein Sfulv_25950 [Streptomyces fulvorobeus]